MSVVLGRTIPEPPLIWPLAEVGPVYRIVLPRGAKLVDDGESIRLVWDEEAEASEEE